MIRAHKYFGNTEAEIINFSLRNYETVAWDVVKQETVVNGDKHIDCLEINVSDWGDSSKEEWAINFYFNITDCIVMT